MLSIQMNRFIKISEAAKILGISIQILRCLVPLKWVEKQKAKQDITILIN